MLNELAQLNPLYRDMKKRSKPETNAIFKFHETMPNIEEVSIWMSDMFSHCFNKLFEVVDGINIYAVNSRMYQPKMKNIENRFAHLSVPCSWYIPGTFSQHTNLTSNYPINVLDYQFMDYGVFGYLHRAMSCYIEIDTTNKEYYLDVTVDNPDFINPVLLITT